MDGDVEMSSDSSSGSLSAVSTSSSTSSTLELVGDELETLTRSMAEISLALLWSNIIQVEVSDQIWCTVLLPAILFYFTQALAKTTLKNKVIPSNLSAADHAEVLSKFDGKTLQEWKNATRKGVLKDDWSDLTKLGMNIVDYRMTSFLLNRHLSKASKSKHAECRVWCSCGTQCVFLSFSFLMKLTLIHGIGDGMSTSLLRLLLIKFIAVISAWKLTYLGDAHKVLLRAVDELHGLREEHNYAKVMPITQSSGTGKSKTIDRISMERILLPICLREDLGENTFGT